MVEGTRGGQDARGGATSNGVGAAARLRTRMRIADERGWTLMEVLVACSMIAILTGIAVPQYTQVALQMRTSAAATQMVSDLNYAREMAQRTGVPHYINVIAGWKSDTFLGAVNSNTVGLTVTTLFGGKLGLTVAYSGDVFVGVKHELSASVNSSINLGLRYELAMVDKKDLAVNNMTIGLTLSAIATKIRAHGTRLTPAGFTVM